MIIDSNATPGGLASTDVTPEGFVRLSPDPIALLGSIYIELTSCLALRCRWTCHLLPLQVLRRLYQ